MAVLEGVYACENCFEAYTNKEFEKLRIHYKYGNKITECEKCKGKVEAVQGIPSDGLKLIITEPQDDLEKYYYHMLEEFSLKGLIPSKLKDVYTASEASSLWGDLERRKQMQADQAMKYLATIGSMVKSLFQLLRELRIMDERRKHYEGFYSGKVEKDRTNADDIALKGIWIDKVEGGAQKPSSVYGMATQLGFVTLPDLFYHTYVKNKDDLDKVIDAMRKEGAFNDKVLEVLQRKLAEYLVWVNSTYDEIEQGRKFKLAYLRQHFHVIRMYIDWVRPYIKSVRAYNMATDEKSKFVEDAQTEMLRASEASVMDIELFGQGKEKAGNYFTSCVQAKYHFTSTPTMQYRKEYQPGPVHIGRVSIEIIGFVLTDQMIEKYKKSKIEDDWAVLKTITESMEYLDDTMIDYLKEAEDTFAQNYKVKGNKKEEKKDEEKGFWKSFSKFFKKEEKEPAKKPIPKDNVKKELMKIAKEALYTLKGPGGYPDGPVWKVYDDFKKFFDLITF